MASTTTLSASAISSLGAAVPLTIDTGPLPFHSLETLFDVMRRNCAHNLVISVIVATLGCAVAYGAKDGEREKHDADGPQLLLEIRALEIPEQAVSQIPWLSGEKPHPTSLAETRTNTISTAAVPTWISVFTPDSFRKFSDGNIAGHASHIVGPHQREWFRFVIGSGHRAVLDNGSSIAVLGDDGKPKQYFEGLQIDLIPILAEDGTIELSGHVTFASGPGSSPPGHSLFSESLMGKRTVAATVRLSDQGGAVFYSAPSTNQGCDSRLIVLARASLISSSPTGTAKDFTEAALRARTAAEDIERKARSIILPDIEFHADGIHNACEKLIGRGLDVRLA